MVRLRMSILGVHGELVLTTRDATRIRDRLNELLSSPSGQEVPAPKPPPPPPKGPQPPPAVGSGKLRP